MSIAQCFLLPTCGRASVPSSDPDGLAIQLIRASNQYLTRADGAEWVIGAGFTAAGWIYRDAAGATTYITGKYASGQREWSLNASATNLLAGRLSSDGNTAQTILTSTLSVASTATWMFVSLRYDSAQSGAELALNKNAETKQTAAHAGGIFNGTSAVRLGASDFAITSSMDGRMDSWGYWSRGLSDAEITSLYNGGAGHIYSSLTAGLKTGLIAWYDLQETSGDRLDSTDNNLDMTPVNAPGGADGI